MAGKGITLLDGDNCTVANNTFQDNSDVNFIMGSGFNAEVLGNTVKMQSGKCFAGMMLDNFDGSTKGNYINMLMTHNQIDCGSNNLCDYGIQFGPGSWYIPPQSPQGGEVSGNFVSNANILYNFNRMGTNEYPLAFFGNSYGSFPSAFAAYCGKKFSGSAINIFSSVVDRHGESDPAALTQDTSQCP